VRRLKRKWQLQASYTYSVTKGDAEQYLSILGNDPGLAEWEPGFLNYDQRNVVKVNAVAFLPHDWRLGGVATWSSGLPFSETLSTGSADDAGYFQSRLLFAQLGPTGFGITPMNRNTFRNHASYRFDTRLMKSFVMGKASSSVFFEIYNLLNTDDLRLTQLTIVPPFCFPPKPGQEQECVPGTVRSVGTRDFGRRFQVGLQVDF